MAVEISEKIRKALDEPQFRSRQAEIIAQVRQEQARRANNGRVVPAVPRRSPIWTTPRWAGALAAVFVLLVVAVVGYWLVRTLMKRKRAVVPGGSRA